MIDKKDIVEFFNRCAVDWDDCMIKSDEIINIILTNAGVKEGGDVLDVACGTGVLFPYYLDRKVASLTGIDISPKMVEVAKTKEGGGVTEVICGDVEEYDFGKQFDSVVVYNAFPHFPDPARLIKNLADRTKPGGRMTIAHGMSRAAIDHHHEGPASKVSNGLMHEDELKKLFEPYFDVDVVISTDTMYQVAGKRKQ